MDQSIIENNNNLKLLMEIKNDIQELKRLIKNIKTKKFIFELPNYNIQYSSDIDTSSDSDSDIDFELKKFKLP